MKTIKTKEKKNKKRGLFFTLFLHGSIVALALIPFLTINPMEEIKEKELNKKPKAIMINFAPSKAKSPKPRSVQAPPKTEELKPTPVKPSPKPVTKPSPKPKPAAKPTPKPRPTPKPSPKPVTTAPQPDVPSMPKPTAPPAPAPPAPAPSPVAAPSPAPAAPAPAPSPAPSNGTVGQSDQPSDSVEGEGDDDGQGIFGRQVIYRPNIKNLTKKSGKIQVEMCVNRDGKVVSTRYIEDGSNMDDEDLIAATLIATKKYKFEKDYSVPNKQCGKMTFIFSID